MATDSLPALSDPALLTAPAAVAEPAKPSWLDGWNEPWWKPAIGIPLYALAAGLLLGGLVGGSQASLLHALELLAIGLLAADARGWRQRIPVLNSTDRAVAAGGWAILLLAAVALAVLLPAV